MIGKYVRGLVGGAAAVVLVGTTAMSYADPGDIVNPSGDFSSCSTGASSCVLCDGECAEPGSEQPCANGPPLAIGECPSGYFATCFVQYFQDDIPTYSTRCTWPQ